jgi:tRNA(Ile)-lysidine synthase
MDLLEQFTAVIKQQNLFAAKDKLLLAVSGGEDSVVLCELCNQAGFDFIIAHCNFQLREEESERDENFVRGLAKKYNVNVLVKKFDTKDYVADNKLSVQVAARELRYEWFNELLQTDKLAGYVLTAHHADDNAETVLMNFFRGTGLHGLTGMPSGAGLIRRPLLGFSKEELQAFSRKHQLEFVEDSSNQSTKYTRNLFRYELIPLLQKVYPSVKENLQDNIRRFSEIEQLYRFSTGELIKKLCRKKGNEIHIPVKQLLSYQSRALIFALISMYDFNEKQVDEVLKLAESDSGRFIQSPSGKFRVIKHRHWFVISPHSDPEALTILIEKNDNRVQFTAGCLVFETVNNTKPAAKDSSIAELEAGDIEFPLLLRKWKQGDYFYPLGMKKKKKLSRFFIDQKLSKTDKEKIWVLEMNKKIIWVVGQRIDDRFKITENTKKILRISHSRN